MGIREVNISHAPESNHHTHSSTSGHCAVGSTVSGAANIINNSEIDNHAKPSASTAINSVTSITDIPSNTHGSTQMPVSHSCSTNTITTNRTACVTTTSSSVEIDQHLITSAIVDDCMQSIVNHTTLTSEPNSSSGAITHNSQNSVIGTGSNTILSTGTSTVVDATNLITSAESNVCESSGSGRNLLECKVAIQLLVHEIIKTQKALRDSASTVAAVTAVTTISSVISNAVINDDSSSGKSDTVVTV